MIGTPGALSIALEMAKAEAARRAVAEKCRYYTPCGKLQDFANLMKNAIDPQETYIFICTSANGIGKSVFAANLAAYFCGRIPNMAFNDIAPLRNFIQPNRGRILTTAYAGQTVYAEKEIPAWFPKGQYQSLRESHIYDVKFKFPATGSEFDVFTFNQDPKEGESVTLNWAIIDEPLPYNHWVPLKSRFRFGGIIVFVMTALYDSGWVSDELDTPERIGKDVFKIQIDMEAACKDHGINGHLPHSYITQMTRDTDEDEYEARISGGYLSLSGRVYKQFDDSLHVWDDLPPYHQECWEKNQYTLYQIIDPHDRKPFAIGWYAVFPNQDVVCVAEWPTFDFYKAKSSDVQIDEYRKIFKETETAMEHISDVRLMDPEFANAPKLGNKGAKAAIEGPCLDCYAKDKSRLACPHSFYFDLPPNEIHYGILKVKELLGNKKKNTRPKLYFMRHCKNHVNAHTRWSYVENAKDSKGLSEMVQDKFKDFCDLARYGALYEFKYIKKEIIKQEIWKPRNRGGYLGI